MDNADRYMNKLFGETLEEVAHVRQAAWTDKSQQLLNNRKAAPLNGIAKLIHFLKTKKDEVEKLEIQDFSEEL